MTALEKSNLSLSNALQAARSSKREALSAAANDRFVGRGVSILTAAVIGYGERKYEEDGEKAEIDLGVAKAPPAMAAAVVLGTVGVFTGMNLILDAATGAACVAAYNMTKDYGAGE